MTGLFAREGGEFIANSTTFDDRRRPTVESVRSQLSSSTGVTIRASHETPTDRDFFRSASRRPSKRFRAITT